MLELKPFEAVTVQYTKDSGDEGDISTRTIIPTVAVPKNVKAVDISAMNEDEQQHVIHLLQEYGEYVKEQSSKTFKFADWDEHTTGKSIDVNWRTFKVEQIQLL